ncbi:MAG: cadherin-like domain-containing protein [Oligosphaeraceae bacterium]
MISRFAEFLRKGAAWAVFLAATLLLSQGVRADWTIDLVSGSEVNGTFLEGKYIDGVSTRGATQVYLTTDENNCQMLNLLLLRDDTQEWAGITWEEVLGGKGNTPVLASTKIQLYPNAGVGQILIPANSNRVLLGTVYHNLLNGTDSTGAVGFDKLNSAQSTNAGIYTSKVKVNGPGSVMMLKGFNFTVAEGAAFETDEEVPLEVSPWDEVFTCTAWNGTDLVPTTAVEFTKIALAPESIGAGSVVITKDGGFLFTPKKDFFGTVTLEYTASSTEGKGSVDGTLTVTVNNVDDIPTLTNKGSSFVLIEGKAVKDLGDAIYLNFSEEEVDREPSLKSEATLTFTPVDGEGETITFPVTLTPVTTSDREPGTYTYSVDFSQVDLVIPYTTVKHPAARKEYTGILSVTDGGKEAYAVTLDGIPAIVKDVDIAPVITGFGTKPISGMLELVAGKVRTWKVQADSLFTPDVLAADADEEDEVTVSLEYFYEDMPAMTFTQIPSPLEKGRTLVAVATAASGTLGAALRGYYQVVNKAPELAENSGRIFIRRGGSTLTGSVTLEVTDVDGADDITVNKGYDDTSTLPDGLTIDRKDDGNVATLTLTFTVPESALGGTEDLQARYSVWIGDADQETSRQIYTLEVDFKENPVPVVTLEESSVTIAEVDAEGNPTSFLVKASATDSDVYPAGVGAWKLQVPEGWSYQAISEETGSQGSGTPVYSASWKVTSNGYDTIALAEGGASRLASDLFTVKVIAVDGETQGEGSADMAVTVNDVDRAPTVPTILHQTPGEAFHGDTLTIDASGSVDADGDPITYAYLWSYSADGVTFTEVDGEGEKGDTLSLAAAIKKGYTVKVASRAVTSPYGEGAENVFSELSQPVSLTIGNTVPFFYHVGDQPGAATDPDMPENPLEYVWEIAEDAAEQSLYVTAFDVDAADGVDSLTYSVEALEASVGTVSIDAATGKLTFTPAKDYFNDGESMPQVVVSAVDESGAAALLVPVISLKVTSVNDAPVVKAEDQYVLPDQRGEELTASFSVDMGPGEETQELSDGRIIDVSDPEGIFAQEPVITVEKSTATLVYTVKEEAELGKSATITFAVKDNGLTGEAEDPQESEPVTITVFVGASPWYPIISFTCVDPEAHADGHTFLLESEEDTLEITVKGSRTQLLPGDYAAVGFKGYPENTDLKATILVWTITEGTTDEVCAQRELSVGEYGLPGRATCAVERVTADENGWVMLPEIQVPMARSYRMQVVDAQGNPVQSIGPVDFPADGKGMILPTITGQELQIPQAGEYGLLVTGINPAGEGEETQVLVIEVPTASEVEIAWGTTPAFAPANGKVLTSGKVKFSWPVATNSNAYDLVVYGPDGRVAETVKDLAANNATLELPMGETPATYTWYVTAKGNGKTIASEQRQFTLAPSTRLPIIAGVYNENGKLVIRTEGVVDESVQIAYDCQYFSIPEMKWFYGFQVPASLNDEGALEPQLEGIPVADGDYVVLLLYVDGEPVGDYVVYLVQPSLAQL